MPTTMNSSTGALDGLATPLLALGQLLQKLDYTFTTVTPATQRLVNCRPGNEFARSLRDVFGWSRPFSPNILPLPLFEAMRAARACEPIPGSLLWRSTVRFSSLDGLLFMHSAFPTEAPNAVFFGPDTSRFVRVIKDRAPAAKRVVDIGCGSGAGGIALARSGVGSAPVVLSDISPEALRFARVNAALAGVPAEIIESDILSGVEGEVDLVIANPPYLRDDRGRLYRDGGGEFGEALAVRMVDSAIERLAQTGGTLLLYTGSAIVEGSDTFLAAVRAGSSLERVRYSYEELDPDVFGEELARPAYARAERIAAVFLQVWVEGRGQ